MLPEEVFKRRHRGTPESFSLVIVNAIVIALIGPGFIKCHHIGWAFWPCLAALAAYNFFTVRRNRETFDKVSIFSYTASLVIMAGVIVLLVLKDC